MTAVNARGIEEDRRIKGGEVVRPSAVIDEMGPLERRQGGINDERQQARDETPRFVVVEPLRDMPAPPQPKAELSDMDRRAEAPRMAERPENALPFSRGDTAERVEAAPEERPMGRGPQPEPSPPAPPERMAENLARSDGLLLAERFAYFLAPSLGRPEAQRLVGAAATRCATSGRSLAEELAGDRAVTAHVDADELARAMDPAGYLGSAGELVDRALARYRATNDWRAG